MSTHDELDTPARRNPYGYGDERDAPSAMVSLSGPVYGRSVIPDRFRSTSQARVGVSSVPATFRTTSAPRLPRS